MKCKNLSTLEVSRAIDKIQQNETVNYVKVAKLASKPPRDGVTTLYTYLKGERGGKAGARMCVLSVRRIGHERRREGKPEMRIRST